MKLNNLLCSLPKQLTKIPLEQPHFFESSAFDEKPQRNPKKFRTTPTLSRSYRVTTAPIPPTSTGWSLIPTIPSSMRKGIAMLFLALKTLCCQFGFPATQPTSEDAIC